MVKSKKTAKKDLPPYLFPKDLDGVKLFVAKCFAAYGFHGKKSQFKCNPFLFVSNLSFSEEEGKIVVTFDVDYDNGENLVTKSMSAKYDLNNYKTLVKDVKGMIAGAEKLSDVVFVGEKFNKKIFNIKRMDLSGWNIIR